MIGDYVPVTISFVHAELVSPSSRLCVPSPSFFPPFSRFTLRAPRDGEYCAGIGRGIPG